MSSFNAFTQKVHANAGQSVPVWLGVVSPRPVGGILTAPFRKAGILIPAGTPVYYNEAAGTIAPFAAWEVVSVDSTNHVITVKASALGVLPAANDYLGIVGATFAATGAAGKVSAVAPAATAGQYDFTIATSALDGVTAGQYLAWSSAESAGSSGKSLANQPNGYLYNDICIDPLFAGESYESINASGAVVDFHGEGLLIKRTPGAPFAAQLKSAIPNVVQVGF